MLVVEEGTKGPLPIEEGTSNCKFFTNNLPHPVDQTVGLVCGVGCANNWCTYLSSYTNSRIDTLMWASVGVRDASIKWQPPFLWPISSCIGLGQGSAFRGTPLPHTLRYVSLEWPLICPPPIWAFSYTICVFELHISILATCIKKNLYKINSFKCISQIDWVP